MSLFRVNGEPLKFDLVGLNDRAFANIEKIVVEHGGMIEHNEAQPIKFTNRFKYVTHAYPTYKLYNTKFIVDCANNNAILNPSAYRIGPKLLYDDCVMHHFLCGSVDCCRTESTHNGVKTEHNDSMDTGEDTSEAETFFDGNDKIANGETSQAREFPLPPESDDASTNNIDDESSDANSDSTGGRSNGRSLQDRPLLQPKINVPIPEETSNKTSSMDRISMSISHSRPIAGGTPRKQPHGRAGFIPDSDGEENIVPEDERNRDDESIQRATSNDDGDEAPREQAANADRQQRDVPRLTIEIDEKRSRNSTSRKRGRGPKITPHEDKQIVKYLAENRVIGEVEKGLAVWYQLLNAGLCKNRTPNSLYKHFYKYILPRIRTFKLTESQLRRFERLAK